MPPPGGGCRRTYTRDGVDVKARLWKTLRFGREAPLCSHAEAEVKTTVQAVCTAALSDQEALWLQVRPLRHSIFAESTKS
jgi:hypothetical protein